jgi:hypothetical protein
MGKVQRLKLEKFFHDLEKFNRVVVKDAHCASDDDGFNEAKRDLSPTTERRTFIRVGCDLESAEPKKPDAELA